MNLDDFIITRFCLIDEMVPIILKTNGCEHEARSKALG